MFVTYKRKDGVGLSGTIYLPVGYQKGTRVPMLVWAYPREFVDADAASQVVGSPNRFTSVGGSSHLLLLTQGYAIFDGPTMPIVGPGETANDTYVEQLVASAEAAIDKAVELGIAERDRIGVGGHSYGAFMTANLLAHSDLFAAGVARSGAYNRTLTPFGFQAETRTFWEIPEIYAKMSPFWNAHKINEPILLIHGEADDNSGTFPIQSERLYMALKGHGATVRYVTLPHEAHGYAARESNLHVLAETIEWLDKYVKNATARTADRQCTSLTRPWLSSLSSKSGRPASASSAGDGDASRRRLGCRGPIALSQVREHAAGRRLQDPRRLQHGRAAHRRRAAARRRDVFIGKSRAGDGARRTRAGGARGCRHAHDRAGDQGGWSQGLRRRDHSRRNDLRGSPGSRRGRSRGARPDHGASLRSRVDHRRPGNRRTRDSRATAGRGRRGGSHRWRRPGRGRRRGHQTVEALGTRDRCRAHRRSGDEGLTRSRSSRDTGQTPRASPTGSCRYDRAI